MSFEYKDHLLALNYRLNSQDSLIIYCLKPQSQPRHFLQGQ